MFDSSDGKDDKPATLIVCQALNLTSTVLTASGSLHSDDSEDALQSAETNLSMINLLKELPSTALEIQSELSSAIALATSSLTAVAELASFIEPTASLSDTNLQICPLTSTPSNIPLSVPPTLSEALSAALEISSAVSAVQDIADVASNVFSLNNVGGLSRSDSSHLFAYMDNFRTSIPDPFTVQKVSSAQEDNPAGFISDFLQSELSLGDLPKTCGRSVVAELLDKSSNEMLSPSPLGTKLSTMASSPLVPLISMVELIDEVTPLLQSARRIAWIQVSILLFLQMVGPLTTHVVSPFTTELIRGAIGPNVGTNEQLEYVAEYLVWLKSFLLVSNNEGNMFGELQWQRSMFYFAEASTVLFWSRASDKVGRKPVILFGLMGSSLSMMCFGISQSFWSSFVSYSLMSGLNGNDGVIKGMMTELVDPTDLARVRTPDKSSLDSLKHLLKVYAFIPLANSAGALIGPIINNCLSRLTSLGKLPVSTFDQASVDTFNIFLYLFTCSVPAMLSITSFVLAFFFLKETVKSPAPLSTLFKLLEVPNLEGHHESQLTHVVDLQDGLAIGGAVVSVVAKKLPFNPSQLLSIRYLFTNPPVIISLGNFAFLSFIEIAFGNIQLLFLLNPTSFGGLGFSAERTDNILSACEIVNGIVQLMFFTKIHNHLGPKKSVTYGVAAAVPLFLMFPVTSFVARDFFNGIILWMALGVQVILFLVFNLAFGAIFMYITASSPASDSVGAINGLSQMLVNLLRGVAPGMTSGLFVFSVEKGYLGGNLVYIVLAAIAVVATMVAWYLPHELWATC